MRISDWSSDVCSSDLSAHSMTTAPAKRRLLHAISCLSSTPPDPHCSLCSVANSPQRVILQRKLSLSLRPAFKSHLVTSPATGLFLAGIDRKSTRLNSSH